MTLQRILETEAMDTQEEARDYNDMDHTQVNRRFVDDLLANQPVGSDILDLGTGTALIPIELCQRFELCRVMAADLSIHMLDLARLNTEIAGLTDRVQLDHVDAKQLHYQDAYFDVVLSNSIVHHIPEPLKVLRESVRVLRPGGLLFLRDLMRPSSGAEVQRLAELHCPEANDHQRKMFVDSLHAALNLDEIRDLVQQLDFCADTVQATSDRHWTWTARKVEQSTTS